jgi:uncharacterized membrane protein
MNLSMLVASAVAATVVGVAMAADTGAKAEKCYGVNAAGKNDCSAQGVHGCAGESKVARDPKSWIYVPVGTCTKIEGGSTTPKGA